MSGSRVAAPPVLRTLVSAWKSLLTDLFGVYHPERHYMRGPGPKWREKHSIHHVVLRRSPPAQSQLARAKIRI